jgi:hypothetical protein
MCASPFLTIEGEAPFCWVSLGLRKADTFMALVVQDFDRVAVEDGGDGTREVGYGEGWTEQGQ